MKGNEMDYRPLSFWSWNGEMEKEEVCRQIRQFARQGYGGFFIHARAGLLIDYMKDDWMEACSAAIEEAKAVGLSVWLYDENGWPSGFASGEVNGQGEEYQAKKLFFTDTYFEDEIGRRFLAAYSRQEGTFVRCEPKAPEAVLFCGYEIVEHYADILSRDVVGRFIQVTHQSYYDRFKEYFGTVIRGIFTDEPQTMLPAWSPAIEKEYNEKWNADILDDLWMLYEEQGEYRNFRYRYYDTVSSLFVNNFTKQIHEWCEDHGILFTGHFPNEDGVCMQIKLNGGVMPNYPYMGMPGIDFLGKRYPSQVLMKQVSSVAHQTGKKHVLSESYGCAGWDITFQELMSLAAYQAVMGVNTICTHLSAYTIYGRRKRDYPAFYSYQEPWWEQFSFVSGYIKRVNEILSNLQRFTHVAVLHPLRSIWCEAPTREEAQGVTDAGQGAAESIGFRTLVELLNDLQIDFDLIDDDMLIQMKCEEGVIKNEHVSYDILIIPYMTSICGRTSKFISQFGKQGGHVMCVNGAAKRIEGRRVQEVLDCPFTEVYNSHNSLMKQFLTMQYHRECVLLDQNQHNPIRGLIINYGESEDGRVCFAFNQSDGLISTTVRQAGCWYPYLYDCAEDKLKEIPYVYDGSCTYAHVEIKEKDGLMIRFYQKPMKACAYMKETRQYLAENIVVTRTEENSFNIDYASFRIDRSEWSELLPVVRLADCIYQQNTKESKLLQVRYHFTTEYIPECLTLAVENVNDVEVKVNDIVVEAQKDWWLDKKISRYNVSGFVIKGENEVILSYPLENKEEYVDLDERFESERNRFSYKIEPESIYLLGEFDVCSNRTPKVTPCYISLEDEAGFYLAEPSCKKIGNLVEQGLWFYRGSAKYTFDFVYDGKNPICIKVKDMKGTGLVLNINEKDGGVHTGSHAIDITEWLAVGKNRIVLTILGHNRNLLGPHHHQKYNPIFVGPSTFNGRKGFEDFVNSELIFEDTWTGEYCFVPFGCDGAEIIEGVLE